MYKKDAKDFEELMPRVAEATRITMYNDKALNSEEYHQVGEALLTGNLRKSNEAVNDFFKVYGRR